MNNITIGILSTQTTILNPCFPHEILDYIIDILHDEPETLKQCCLVSRSWVPRTRKHLFADIKLHSPNNLKSWMKTFPDPVNSPAYHACALEIVCVVVDSGESDWIQRFSHVERLTVNYISAKPNTLKSFLVPFQFSPSIKSLHVTCFSSLRPQTFHLVQSLPLLEDLTLIGRGMSTMDEPSAVVPWTSPALTGNLELFLFEGLRNTTF